MSSASLPKFGNCDISMAMYPPKQIEERCLLKVKEMFMTNFYSASVRLVG